MGGTKNAICWMSRDSKDRVHYYLSKNIVRYVHEEDNASNEMGQHQPRQMTIKQALWEDGRLCTYFLTSSNSWLYPSLKRQKTDLIIFDLITPPRNVTSLFPYYIRRSYLDDTPPLRAHRPRLPATSFFGVLVIIIFLLTTTTGRRHSIFVIFCGVDGRQ
jgi:hypothetical protein